MSDFYGLLGEKLSHSMSPKIHSFIFKELNIEGNYNLFEVKKEEIKDAVYGLKALGAKGTNVTIPYKFEVMKYIDEISPEAQRIGAINTICFNGDKTKAYNTDYYGFGMMLKKYDVNLQGVKAVVLGAGGAAKAVIQYLIDNGALEVLLITRDTDKAKKAFKNVKVISYEELELLDGGDIIVNSTPCGMYPNVDNSAVNKECIAKFKTAVDLIYNPVETLFLKHAKESGLKAINGMYMLVGQAIASEELWNNIKIEDEIVDKVYKYMLE